MNSIKKKLSISSIAHETKLIVDKGSTLKSDCVLDVHGYIKGNIWVISHRANRIKNDSTPKEIKKLIAALNKLERI